MASDTQRIEPGGDPRMYPHPNSTPAPADLTPHKRWCERCSQEFDESDNSCPGCAQSTD